MFLSTISYIFWDPGPWRPSFGIFEVLKERFKLYVPFCAVANHLWSYKDNECSLAFLSRGVEHLEHLEANDEDKSVLWLHSKHHHQSRRDVKYSMKVTGAFQDPLDRQIMEKIQIQNFKGPVLMNRRSEMGGVRVERMQYRRWGGGN